jgi:hypothetical protein
MYLYKFELSYIKDNIKHYNTRSKLCNRYRSTKIYKSCMQTLSDPDSKYTQLRVYI